MEGKEIFKRGWHPSTELLVSALVTDVLMRHLLIMGLSFTLNRDEQLGAPASDTGPREDGAERPRAEGWGWDPPGATGQDPPPRIYPGAGQIQLVLGCWVHPLAKGGFGGNLDWGAVTPLKPQGFFFFWGGGHPCCPPHLMAPRSLPPPLRKIGAGISARPDPVATTKKFGVLGGE